MQSSSILKHFAGKISDITWNFLRQNLVFLDFSSAMLARNFSQSQFMLGQTGKHKIGLVQMTCKSDKAENFEIAKNLIRNAKEKGALVKRACLLS